MERINKFRAWDGEKMKPAPILNEGKYYSVAWGTLDYPVMQYVGLLDKNGTEIYENDIVKDRFGRIMKVGYWNYRLCWIAITETNFHHADFYDWVENDDNGEYNNVARVEVIGNLYESPELITNQTTAL